MRDDKDEQAEIEALKERLRRFTKSAKSVNYHDAERMRRAKEGREGEQRGGWRELAKRP